MTHFELCLQLVLKHEGGYVNDPDDPGGETNLGVTKKTYTNAGGKKEMKDLTIEDVMPIYKKYYWDRVRADSLPRGLDLSVFDFAVNAGAHRAIVKLQQCVDAEPDGIMGPKTIKAINACDLTRVLIEYTIARQQHYESLGIFNKYGKGWTRRNIMTLGYAMKATGENND